MSAIDRRRFLESIPGALAGFVFADACGDCQAPAPPLPVSQPSRWVDPLPALEKLAPVRRSPKLTSYRVRMLEFLKRLHSELPPTRLWGYEGQYPGPVIEAQRGEAVEIRWENQLPPRHLFAIDPSIHGAMPPAPAVRTVPHLHGSRSSSKSDGLPENWFEPGRASVYSYPNDQPAATLWYHDHALGITRLNVYAGLSGLFLLRDDEERRAALPAGEYELPLVLQDRTLDAAGQLVYAPTFEDGSVPLRGEWAPEFFGLLPVVNGAVFPYVEVEPRPYRLRLLNAANARFFNLYFNLAESPTDIPHLISFQQVGTDGGLLSRPAALQELLLGPAERADLLVDFSSAQGRTVTLSNRAAAPFPGWEFSKVQHAALYELLRFRVTRPYRKDRGAVALGPLPALVRLDPGPAPVTRDFVLSEAMDAQGHSTGVRINGKGYADPVTELVQLGATETWRFINTTDDAHPMHLHLVQFQIVERQGYDVASLLGGKVVLVGRPRPAPAHEEGWKDTAVVFPREVLSLRVRFEGFTGRYVFHCHMLEHEDNDMMRPYEIVAKAAAPSG